MNTPNNFIEFVRVYPGTLLKCNVLYAFGSSAHIVFEHHWFVARANRMESKLLLSVFKMRWHWMWTVLWISDWNEMKFAYRQSLGNFVSNGERSRYIWSILSSECHLQINAREKRQILLHRMCIAHLPKKKQIKLID